jgi:DNA-binding LytR/AlgR family response regulator
MKVIIIEDEKAAQDNLKAILTQIDLSIEVIGCFDSIKSSVLWLRNNLAPDIIFMDIELSDGNAFNIFECVDITSPIIFTTAYNQYALDAFKVSSIDYLLKPITIENVNQAIKKLELIKGQNMMQLIQNLSAELRPKDYTTRILIPVRDKIIPIKTDTVRFLYNTNGVTEIYTFESATPYRIDKSLDSIFTNLNPTQFFRANRQFILHRESVRDITVWFDSRLLINLIIDAPEKVYVSKNRAAEFKLWFASN